MNIQNKNKPVYAFIDSQNLNLGVRSLRWELDYNKFFIYLKDKYKVAKAFIFIGMVPGNETLYEALSGMGYTLIYKPTLEYSKDGEKHTKGNVDAELVLQTMIEWDNFDKAIIVSGDGDFYCLIEHLHNKQKLFKLITPNAKYSSHLRKFANYIVRVSQFRSKVAKTKTPRPMNGQKHSTKPQITNIISSKSQKISRKAGKGFVLLTPKG